MPIASSLRYKRLIHLNLTNNAINLAQSNKLGHRIQVNVNTDDFSSFFYWFRSNLEGRPVGHFQDTNGDDDLFLDFLKETLETPYTDFDAVPNGLTFTSSVITALPDASRLRKTGTISVNDWIVSYVLYKCYGKSSYDTSELYNVEDMYDMLLTHDVAQEIVTSLNTEEAITVAVTGTSGEPGYIDTMFAQHLASNPMRFFDSSGKQVYGLFEINPDDDAFGGWCLENGDTFEIPIAMTFQKPVTMVGTPDPLSESRNNNEDPSNTNLTKVISSNDSFRVRLQFIMNGAGNQLGGPAGFFTSTSSANFSKTRVGSALVLRFNKIYYNGVLIPNNSASSVSMTVNGTTVTGTAGSIVFTFPGFNFAGAGASISYTLAYEGKTIVNSFPFVDIVTSNILAISDANENLTYLFDIAADSLTVDIAEAAYNLETITNIDAATITAKINGSNSTVSGTFDTSGFHFFFGTLPASTAATLTIRFTYMASYVELTIQDTRYSHVLSTNESFSISASYPTTTSLRLMVTGITDNGVLLTSGDLTVTPSIILTPVIGSYSNGTWTFLFTGLTDITPTEYNFTFSYLGSELIEYGIGVAAYSSLRVHLIASTYDGSGAWQDETAYQNDATLAGGTIAKNADGNGIVLDGSTYWTFPDVVAGSNWTITAWYNERGNPIGDGAQVVTQSFTDSSINLALGYYHSSPEFYGMFYDSGGQWSRGTLISVVQNRWNHISVTFDGTNITTYLNNTSLGFTTANTGSTNSVGNAYYIGKRWDAPSYIVGEIGEVRIYNTVLSAEEISTLYNNSKATYPVLSVTMTLAVDGNAGTYTTEGVDASGNLTFSIQASAITLNETPVEAENANLLTATTVGDNTATATYANDAFHFTFAAINTSDPTINDVMNLTFTYNTTMIKYVNIVDPRYVAPTLTLTTSANITAEFTSTGYGEQGASEGDIILHITVPLADLTYTGASTTSSNIRALVSLKDASGNTNEYFEISLYNEVDSILRYEITAVLISDATDTVSLDIEFSYVDGKEGVFNASSINIPIEPYSVGDIFTLNSSFSIESVWYNETSILEIEIVDSMFLLNGSTAPSSAQITLSFLDLSAVGSNNGTGLWTFILSTTASSYNSAASLSGYKTLNFAYSGAGSDHTEYNFSLT